MEDSNFQWKIISLFLAASLVTLGTLYELGVGYTNTDSINDQNDFPRKLTELNLWKKEAPLRVMLEEYIKNITSKNSTDYIPLERRIAVFDWDGTVFSDTDPVDFEYHLLKYRLLEDPDYIDKASDFEKETAQKIQNWIDTGIAAENLGVDHGKCVASSFKGMTINDISDYVLNYSNKPSYGYNGMNIGDAVFKPMKQVINYLQDYNFKVYVVSGTDRLIIRPLAVELLGLPESQIIGSDELLVAKNQNNTDGTEYQYTFEDEIVSGGDLIIKNLKMNKVINIAREIGIQPVLAFGNSPGDFSMARYTMSNNAYKSAAFMVCCDDTERENCDIEKTNKLIEDSAENGFITVSMKNDWLTIFGEDVTKKTNSNIKRSIKNLINKYKKYSKRNNVINNIRNY